MKITATLLLILICIQLYACNGNIGVGLVTNSNAPANTDTMKDSAAFLHSDH